MGAAAYRNASAYRKSVQHSKLVDEGVNNNEDAHSMANNVVGVVIQCLNKAQRQVERTGGAKAGIKGTTWL